MGFKGLYHGWLLRVVYNASNVSSFAIDLEKLLVNDKIAALFFNLLFFFTALLGAPHVIYSISL